MCIIVYKPQDKEMPSKEILKECFRCNPDGAGYMFPEDNMVRIRKGFMTFDDFYKALISDYTRIGASKAFVMHFRIGTQGGNTPENTHPFPLSKDMKYLKALEVKAKCGIAHNGIISLTSHSHTRDYEQVWDEKLGMMKYVTKTVDYSDTMEFITEYLALIIKNKNWYKNEDNVKLIKKLVGTSNKFAIMTEDGNVTLINDFIEDDGIYYSNSSYKIVTYTQYRFPTTTTKSDEDYLEDLDECTAMYDYFEECWNGDKSVYEFDDAYCPYAEYGDESYCKFCEHYGNCFWSHELKHKV